MTYTESEENALIINKLTKAQYEAITPEPNQLYLTPDTTDEDIANAVSAHNTSNTAHTDIRNAIPTKISDLTDDTATSPVDKADTLTGLTSSITELNYVDGVTSAIQTQLDNKLASKPDGTNNLISNNKVTTTYRPDFLLGQVLYAGNFVPSTAVATLSDNGKAKLGTTSATITLTNDTTAITGYEANEGCYYICTADGTFANISFLTGDWLISTGSAWQKIDNTDAVTGIKGNAESTYRTGNVNITPENIGAITSSDIPVTDVKVNNSSVVTNKVANITVPTVNNPTITITQGGTTKGSFTLNQSSGDTIALDAGGGSSYTAGTGIDITNDTISVTSPVLTNTATGTDSITIGGTASTTSYNINIGNGSVASNSYGVAIGRNARSTQTKAIAIGTNAQATNTCSIQIGGGTNTIADSLQIGFSGSAEYQLLDGTTGLIPDARISSNIIKASNCAEVYPVITTYQNGTSWYRIYSDGWCEQGGRFNANNTTTTATYTVNLLKSYIDTNYSIVTCGYSNHADQFKNGVAPYSFTTSSFEIQTYNNDALQPIVWQTCGYLAEGQY